MANQDDILKVLLSAGDEKPQKEIHIKRLGVNFTLQAVDVEKVREQATYATKSGKQVDADEFRLLLIEKGCVVPNWSEKALVDKYGDAKSAIKRVLLSGERERISNSIVELSGYSDDDDEQVKN